MGNPLKLDGFESTKGINLSFVETTVNVSFIHDDNFLLGTAFQDIINIPFFNMVEY